MTSKNLKKENETYKEYVKNLFSSANLEPLDKKNKIPYFNQKPIFKNMPTRLSSTMQSHRMKHLRLSH